MGSASTCLHGLHAAERLTARWLTTHEGEGQEPAFLALHAPLRWDNEASPSGFHAYVTATTLESRPRRRYVATLQFAKGHPCSMSH